MQLHYLIISALSEFIASLGARLLAIRWPRGKERPEEGVFKAVREDEPRLASPGWPVLWIAGCSVVALSALAFPVSAQELIGRRLFSDNLVISEPFVEDELSFPSVLHIRRPGAKTEPPTLVTEIAAELKKRLTPTFEFSLSGGLTRLDPDGKPSLTGFDNLAVGLKYQFLTSEAHEAVLSAALGWEVGGTGRKATGAQSFDVVNPALLVGKGLGDLPDALAGFKPIATTGVLGVLIPTRASTRVSAGDSDVDGPETGHHPNLLQWGLVIEYSLPYLQAYVKDLRLPSPINRMFPLVELDFQTALDRGAAGRTTGTVNPGVVWAGESLQIGMEAAVPINDRTGKAVGVRAFLRIDLDVILPSLGRPIFGTAGH